jgi:hypothetical protein
VEAAERVSEVQGIDVVAYVASRTSESNALPLKSSFFRTSQDISSLNSGVLVRFGCSIER